jgi:hypothetical protein
LFVDLSGSAESQPLRWLSAAQMDTTGAFLTFVRAYFVAKKLTNLVEHLRSERKADSALEFGVLGW